MTPAEIAAGLLAEFDAAGVELHVVDGRLRAWPAGAITAEVRAIVEPWRAHLLAAVAQRDAAAHALPEAVVDAIERISRARAWSAADALDALDAATSCPDVAGWLELARLVEASVLGAAGAPAAARALAARHRSEAPR